MELIRVAIYRRTIAASLTRIWENVLDWEHLPWLHHSSFAGIDLVSRHADGWRARVSLPPRDHPRPALIDVQLERAQLRYLTRTLEGVGAGTEILTKLTPQGEHSTAIEVEFLVPVPVAIAEQVGQVYTRLYAQLWDEDEAMMVRRQHILDTPLAPRREPREPLSLGPLPELRAGLPLAINVDGQPYRIVEVDDTLTVYSPQCPHLGGPLDDGALDSGIITCPWHGYRFDLRSGKSSDGRKLCLRPAPAVHIEPDSQHVRLIW